jgi:purine-nucleoside phosphorylase
MGNVQFATNSSGFRQINIHNVAGYNALGVGSFNVQTQAVSNSQTILHTARTVSLTSTDTFYLNVYQTSGSNLKVTAVFNAIKLK